MPTLASNLSVISNRKALNISIYAINQILVRFLWVDTVSVAELMNWQGSKTAVELKIRYLKVFKVTEII
jgi:hypothetical protein